jgi:hypothetical protein
MKLNKIYHQVAFNLIKDMIKEMNKGMIKEMNKDMIKIIIYK